MLKEGERIDDLQYKGLKLIQMEGGYAFTSDAVLLANLVRSAKGKRIADLGTGSGVIALLLACKKEAREVVGVELQPRLADMARRSVALNRLEDRVQIREGDIKNAPAMLGKECFDLVVSNPPYRKPAASYAPVSQPNEFDLCTTEYAVTLEEVIASAAQLTRYGGDFWMIVKSDRLTDALSSMRACRLEPKRLIPVQPTPAKDVDTVVLQGKKGGKPGIRFEKPFLVMDEHGEYTSEAKKLYCLC